MKRFSPEITILLTAALVAGCAVPKAAASTEVPKGYTGEKTTTPLATGLPTRKPEATAKPNPTEFVLGYGGVNTQEQMDFLKSKEGTDQYLWLNAWHNYWSSAEQSIRPFFPEPLGSPTSKVYAKPVSDFLNNKKNVLVLESADYPNKVIMPPAWAWEGMKLPPKVELNHGIPEGNGLLEISLVSTKELAERGIPEGSTFVYSEGSFVYINKKGEKVGVVNSETKYWEKWGAINLKNITNRPESEKEIRNHCGVVESPFKDYDKFLVGFREYRKILHENIIDKGYRGKKITHTGNGTGIASDNMSLDNGAEFEIVGCLRFVEDNKDVVILSAVGQNKSGSLSLISFVPDPDATNGSSTNQTVDDYLRLTKNPVKIGGGLAIFNFGLKPFHVPNSTFDTKFSRKLFNLNQKVNIYDNTWDWTSGNKDYDEDALIITRTWVIDPNYKG